jgi:hypothetical protein
MMTGDDAEVALHREGESHADGVTVDRRDDGLSHLPCRETAHPGPGIRGALSALDVIEGLPAAAHVRARAEGLSGAGEDDRANGVVLVAACVGALELRAEGEVECVHSVRTVERDRGHSVLDVEQDVLVGGFVRHVGQAARLTR